jgi:hypothetical protein
MKIWQSFVVMVAAVIIGIVMSLCYGLAADRMHDALVAAEVFNVPTVWSSAALVTFTLSLMYLCIYLIPILGVTIFIITCTFRQQQDYVEDEMQQYF